MSNNEAVKTAKELAAELLNPRKNGFFKVTDEVIAEADANGLCRVSPEAQVCTGR